MITNTYSPRLMESASSPTPSGVTELVLTKHAPDQAALILPMVAYLTHNACERWVTWIAPARISKAVLEKFAINTRRLRLIHTQDEQSILWITWEALAQGNSHTVIANTGKLCERELAELERAALYGHCQGVLLRVRD